MADLYASWSCTLDLRNGKTLRRKFRRASSFIENVVPRESAEINQLLFSNAYRESRISKVSSNRGHLTRRVLFTCVLKIIYHLINVKRMSTILMIYYSIFSNEDSFENAVRKFCIFLYSDDVQNIDKIFENSL